MIRTTLLSLGSLEILMLIIFLCLIFFSDPNTMERKDGSAAYAAFLLLVVLIFLVLPGAILAYKDKWLWLSGILLAPPTVGLLIWLGIGAKILFKKLF